MYYYIRKKIFDILDFIGTFLGNIIVVFRGQHFGDIKKTKKITFDIRARVGDAVINKPLIILFSRYLKEELGLDIEILVETNEYNDFVFRDENFGKYYKIQKFQNEEDVHVTPFKYIKVWLSALLLSKKNQKDKSLVYVASRPNHIIENKGVVISSNIYLDNYLLDFSLKKSVAGYSRHVLNTTIEILVRYFKLYKFEDYIDKNLEIFYQDYKNGKKTGILIFVGNKGFRNLTIEKRYDLILGVSKSYEKENIVVIDDNTNLLYDKLQKYEYSDNVNFMKNSFSIDEFKDYAKNFKLVIGGDGGGFNYIRTVTNSIGIYTVADPNRWHIFSGSNKYEEVKLSSKYYGCYIDINGKKFGYILKKSKILPSYDYSVGNNYFDDLPVDDFVRFVKFFI